MTKRSQKTRADLPLQDGLVKKREDNRKDSSIIGFLNDLEKGYVQDGGLLFSFLFYQKVFIDAVLDDIFQNEAVLCVVPHCSVILAELFLEAAQDY